MDQVLLGGLLMGGLCLFYFFCLVFSSLLRSCVLQLSFHLLVCRVVIFSSHDHMLNGPALRRRSQKQSETSRIRISPHSAVDLGRVWFG